jgi:anti-sigma factor RsiW
MKDMNCEEILIQKMALLDGEKTDAPPAEIDAHLAACETCRRETARLENVASLFERQQRRRADVVDLWTPIERRLGAESKTILKANWQPFALVGALLAALKLAELLPARDFGWALKFAAFVLVVLLFGILKENPFKINTELIPEK